MNSVVIIGKPNSGKSLLFQRLTGVFQKVSNFPGVTVEVKSAKALGHSIEDFPGIYSLNPLTKDEELSVSKFTEALASEDTKLVICVLDVTRMERSLSLGLGVRQITHAHNKNVVFALNMYDQVEKNNINLDYKQLENMLQAKVVPVSARTGLGLDSLKNIIQTEDTAFSTDKEKLNQIFSQHPATLAKAFTREIGLDSEIFIRSQNKIDKYLLNNFFGGFMFFLIMWFLFESIFTWSAPAMDLSEELVLGLGGFVGSFLSDGVFKDFVSDAIFGGVGSFIVFVPQIFVLTFIIGIMEDSGYLARAAIICHKPFHFFGLTGKSFVPILTGHACAIPAVFATRTIESPKKRLLTMLCVPLTACSARLPVYALLITVIIPDKSILGGAIGLRGLTFFLLYFLGIFLALIAAAILSKTVYKDENDSPFVLELPAYRMPQWSSLVRKAGNSSLSFLKNAAGIIFIVSVVVWFLGYFPGGEGDLQNSYLASLGRLVEPIFAPLGIDWRFSVAILTSFLAREVFVGTLGTMLGIEGADDNVMGLADSLSASGMTFATGISLLLFYAVAMQCVSTLAVIKKETGSVKYAVGVFVCYGLAAYVLALITYQILV